MPESRSTAAAMWPDSWWITLQYLQLRIWLGRYFYPKQRKGLRGRAGNEHIVRISPWTVVKLHASISEYLALKMLQNHPIIKVPRLRQVYFKHTKSGRAVCHIAMEYIPGMTLQTAWRQLSQDSKRKIANQLYRVVQDLRLFQPPQHLVGRVTSLEGYQLQCTGISATGGIEDDFPTYDLFLDFWFNVLERKQKRQPVDFDVDSLRASMKTQEMGDQMVFTHGDLTANNIFVDPERATITAIIDWEMAGWMPVCWEHFKALYPAPYRRTVEWPDFVDAIFHDEHAAAFAAVVTVFRNSGLR